jgi:hypothetical protein
MELSIILTTLLKTLISGPDLCADVYVDANGEPYTDAVGHTWSRLCEWAGPDAPVLNANVCCTVDGDIANCVLPDSNDRCSSGSKAYCEFGEVTSAGAVVCYQPFPSICDFGYCGDVLPPNGGPVEDAFCCFSDGSCFEVETYEDLKTCAVSGVYSGFCKNGVQNDDGTVECFD